MPERKVFDDSVVPLPDEPGLIPAGIFQQDAKPEDLTARMTLVFALRPPQERQDELEARVAAGEVVPVKELNERYQVPQASVSALTDWLTGQGYEIERVSDDRTSVYASAPLSVIESSLKVDMTTVSKEGVTYAGAKNAPSLPEPVGADVRAIVGLQPWRRARKHLRRAPIATVDAEAEPAAPVPENGYLVADILKAYNADGVAATGAGQTIAILIDTFPLAADLRQFWQANGLPNDPQRVTMINVRGGPLPARSGEETLDAEWVSGVAPDAKVRIYASGTLAFVALDRALDRIIADLPANPGMRQLSISLGLGELFFGSATGEIATQHDKFLRLAAAGVNVFVSSGDAGSNPDTTGHGSTGPLHAEYEASDPAVVGVGGTSLRLRPNGAVARERGWSGSGGGKSVVFSRPSWQKATGMPAGDERLVPDVSLAADPRTGGMIVQDGQPQSVGGTSWSAPVWAGFCARINDALQRAGKAPLGFLNPRLYPLQGSCFRDVTAGSNGAFRAAAGYDLVTGLGSPNLAALIEALMTD
jgi:kumamolisin